MTHPKEPKLPESLEVVAWHGVDHAGYEVVDLKENFVLRMFDPGAVVAQALVLKSNAESALKARDAEIERLRGVVVETRRVLELENSKGAASAIQDTIWRGSAETLFDYLDASLENGGANV